MMVQHNEQSITEMHLKVMISLNGKYLIKEKQQCHLQLEMYKTGNERRAKEIGINRKGKKYILFW